jgi:photosystem II stability/assembly factor-like uncharacterized protein
MRNAARPHAIKGDFMTDQHLREKDTSKLRGRFNQDFIFAETSDPATDLEAMVTAARTDSQLNPALRRLEAIRKTRPQGQPERLPSPLNPVDPAMANWVEVGPLAINNGQTYGGARVIITGRVTAFCPHPTNPDILYLGSSRGGVWKSTDGGTTWAAKSDHYESLAIGALDISQSNPQVLYAGTGEGNLQLYSTAYPLSSAPGIYLGVGILKTTDEGNTWVNHGATRFANESFYRIAIHPTNPDIAFAATSIGLCRTTDGTTWATVTGGGLPAMSSTVIACTDVLIDGSDSTGNTVFVAFWGDGIYKSTGALSAAPSWTKLTTGLPAGSAISRISLAQAPSSPNTKFALFATSGDAFHSVCRTTNAAGTSWSQCFNTGVQLYGAFTSNIAVDPTTPDTLYVSGVELYKATFSGTSWSVSNVGTNIHPDSHAFAFHPTNSLVIYSGNDGGIFKSSDGGATWDDKFNIGLNILQYEAIDDYAYSDALILGGTQDNGTNSFRNGPVFYHNDDGDGGYCAINEIDGHQKISSYYGVSFKRSTNGGQFGSWSSIASGISGSALFYPPRAKSKASTRVAVGTNQLNVNDTPYTASSWTSVTLPGIVGRVSAVHFANDTTIYAASTSGNVYRCTFSAGSWAAQNLAASPLPSGWIWDVASFPGNPNRIIVVFANFGLAAHAWIGNVPASGAATWAAASGAGATALPDVPYYAVAFEDANTIYVGSDIGVFRTTDGGSSWTNFSQGLPNTAIYDMRFYPGENLLRAATHGRGLWEIKTDAVPSPAVDLYFRDHAMHTGRGTSASGVTAGYPDSLDHVNLTDNLYWWQSRDIKVDAPTSAAGGYQFPVADVDFVTFETALQHDNPDKGNINRVYVRVQNRSTSAAPNVTVKALFAGASTGLPNLPADFWTQFPNDSAMPSHWTAIGPAQTIPLLEPTRPIILEWDWNPPVSADAHSCMLVVMDSPSDPISAANKVFTISELVRNEKRVALKNLHIVDVVPGVVAFVPLHMNILEESLFILRFVYDRNSRNFTAGLVFPKRLAEMIVESQPPGFRIEKLESRQIDALRRQWIEQEYKNEDKVEKYISQLDFRHVFIPSSRGPAIKLARSIPAMEADGLLLGINKQESRSHSKFTIVQEGRDGRIEGGSTFILRNPRKFGIG